MIQRAIDVLPDLYELDETAWLEAMAELIEQGRWGDLDYRHSCSVRHLADCEHGHQKRRGTVGRIGGSKPGRNRQPGVELERRDAREPVATVDGKRIVENDLCRRAKAHPVS